MAGSMALRTALLVCGVTAVFGSFKPFQFSKHADAEPTYAPLGKINFNQIDDTYNRFGGSSNNNRARSNVGGGSAGSLVDNLGGGSSKDSFSSGNIAGSSSDSTVGNLGGSAGSSSNGAQNFGSSSSSTSSGSSSGSNLGSNLKGDLGSKLKGDLDSDLGGSAGSSSGGANNFGSSSSSSSSSGKSQGSSLLGSSSGNSIGGNRKFGSNLGNDLDSNLGGSLKGNSFGSFGGNTGGSSGQIFSSSNYGGRSGGSSSGSFGGGQNFNSYGSFDNSNSNNLLSRDSGASKDFGYGNILENNNNNNNNYNSNAASNDVGYGNILENNNNNNYNSNAASNGVGYGNILENNNNNNNNNYNSNAASNDVGYGNILENNNHNNNNYNSNAASTLDNNNQFVDNALEQVSYDDPWQSAKSGQDNDNLFQTQENSPQIQKPELFQNIPQYRQNSQFPAHKRSNILNDKPWSPRFSNQADNAPNTQLPTPQEVDETLFQGQPQVVTDVIPVQKESTLSSSDDLVDNADFSSKELLLLGIDAHNQHTEPKNPFKNQENAGFSSQANYAPNNQFSNQERPSLLNKNTLSTPEVSREDFSFKNTDLPTQEDFSIKTPSQNENNVRPQRPQPGYGSIAGNNLFQNQQQQNGGQGQIGQGQNAADFFQKSNLNNNNNNNNKQGFPAVKSGFFNNNEKVNDVFRPVSLSNSDNDNAGSKGYQFVTNDRFTPPSSFRDEEHPAVGGDSLETISNPETNRQDVISSYVPMNNWVNPKSFAIGPDDKEDIVSNIFNGFRPNLVTEPLAGGNPVVGQSRQAGNTKPRETVQEKEEVQVPFTDFRQRNEDAFANLGTQNGVIGSYANPENDADIFANAAPNFGSKDVGGGYGLGLGSQNNDNGKYDVGRRYGLGLGSQNNDYGKNKVVQTEQTAGTQVDDFQAGGVVDSAALPDFETQDTGSFEDIVESAPQEPETEVAVEAKAAAPMEFRDFREFRKLDSPKMSPDSQLLSNDRISEETSNLLSQGGQQNIPSFYQDSKAPLINDDNSIFGSSHSGDNGNQFYGQHQLADLSGSFDTDVFDGDYLANPKLRAPPTMAPKTSNNELKPLFTGFSQNKPTSVNDFRSKDLLAGGFGQATKGNNQPETLNVFEHKPIVKEFNNAATTSNGGSFSDSNSFSNGDSYNYGGSNGGRVSNNNDQKNNFRDSFDKRVSHENDQLVSNSDTSSNNVKEGNNYDVTNDYNDSVNFSNNDADSEEANYSTRDGYDQGVSNLKNGLRGASNPLSGLPNSLDVGANTGLISGYKPFDINREQPLGNRNGFHL